MVRWQCQKEDSQIHEAVKEEPITRWKHLELAPVLIVDKRNFRTMCVTAVGITVKSKSMK